MQSPDYEKHVAGNVDVLKKYPNIPPDYKSRIPAAIAQILERGGEVTQKDLSFIICGEDTPGHRAYISLTLKRHDMQGEERDGRKFYPADTAFSLINERLGQWGDGTRIKTTGAVETPKQPEAGKLLSSPLLSKETTPSDNYVTREDMGRMELGLQKLIGKIRGELGSELNRRERTWDKKIKQVVQEATDGFFGKVELEERLEDFKNEIGVELTRYLRKQGLILTSGSRRMKNGKDGGGTELSRGEYKGGLEDIGVKEYHQAREPAQYIGRTARAVSNEDFTKVEKSIKDMLGDDPHEKEYQELIGYATALKISRRCGAVRKDLKNQLIYVISNVLSLPENTRLSIYRRFSDYSTIDPDVLNAMEIEAYAAKIDGMIMDIESLIGDRNKGKLRDVREPTQRRHKKARRKKSS